MNTRQLIRAAVVGLGVLILNGCGAQPSVTTGTTRQDQSHSYGQALKVEVIDARHNNYSKWIAALSKETVRSPVAQRTFPMAGPREKS